MKQEGDDLRAIKGYLDGTGTDQAAAIQKAQDLVATADRIAGLFPAGTSSKDLPGKSNAKPDIWAQRAKYDAAEAARKTATQNLLSAVQKGDKTAGQAAFGEVGKACGACHGTFRETL
jgi:cytochrome c556